MSIIIAMHVLVYSRLCMVLHLYRISYISNIFCVSSGFGLPEATIDNVNPKMFNSDTYVDT